jgi:hypothetical protein
MKKFTIIEQVPALVEYTYEVEAENEDDAMEIIMNGMTDSIDYKVETIYDDVCLEFTRQVTKEEDIED